MVLESFEFYCAFPRFKNCGRARGRRLSDLLGMEGSTPKIFSACGERWRRRHPAGVTESREEKKQVAWGVTEEARAHSRSGANEKDVTESIPIRYSR